MADFNIPAGTTLTVSGLASNSTNTIEGNSTASYGEGGGTLISTGPLPGQCDITVTGGVFDVDGISNNDTITLNNATLDIFGGNWNSTTTIIFGTGSSGVIVPAADATSPDLDGVHFIGMNSGDYIWTRSNSPITNVSFSSDTLHFTQDGIDYAVAMTLAAGAPSSFSVGTENGELVIVDGGLACYVAGTRILTVDGEAPIEQLRAGDMVVDVSGAAQRIVWIGRRHIDIARHAHRHSVAPIRIRQGAFADDMPHRDLLLSPDHAVSVDGQLICVRRLVNGTTIVQETSLASVEYFHVELEEHAILLAEGLPAESYLDTGNRDFFSNSAGPSVLHPNLIDEGGHPAREAGSCAPFWDEASVQSIWQRLAAHAATLGRPVTLPEMTGDAELRVIANGRTLWPVHNDGDRFSFVLPNATTEIRLISRSALPSAARPWVDDQRRLGVYVKRITLRDRQDTVDVPLDSPALRQGWWALEREGNALRRWTAGGAVLILPAAGPVVLEVRVETLRYPQERPTASPPADPFVLFPPCIVVGDAA